MTLEEEAVVRAALADQESKISKNVLKIVDPKLYQNTSFEDKQQEFRETCLAIHTIVVNKLYRCHSGSLESYFKKRWSVSRAQTYRLFECAAVLKMLSHFPVIPHKERICRQLKNSAGLVQHQLEDLWGDVISMTNHEEALINTFNIEEYWAKKHGTVSHVFNDKPKPRPKKKAKAESKATRANDAYVESTEEMDLYDDSDSDNDPPVLINSTAATTRSNSPSRTRPSSPRFYARSSSATNLKDYYAKLPIDQDIVYNLRQKSRFKRNSDSPTFDSKGEQLSKIEQDWSMCQTSIQTLAANGYRVESLVDGEWTQPSMWRLSRPMEKVESKYSLEYLVMAAEWAAADCQ